MKRIGVLLFCMINIQSFAHSKTICNNPSSYILTDTIPCLQKIVKRKNKYIGKKLNVLMKDLAIQPLFFLYNFGGFDDNGDHSKSTSLYFYFYKFDITKKRLASHAVGGFLTVRWQTPLNIDSVVVYSRKNGRHWNKAAEEFYGKQIINDIELY